MGRVRYRIAKMRIGRPKPQWLVVAVAALILAARAAVWVSHLVNPPPVPR